MYIKHSASGLLRGCILFSVLNSPTFCKSAASVLSNQVSSPNIFLLDKSRFWKCYQFMTCPHLGWIILCFVPWIYGYTSDQINLKISQSAGELPLAQGVKLMAFTGWMGSFLFGVHIVWICRVIFSCFYRLCVVSRVSRFNRFLLTREPMLIDLVNHLPLKFRARTKQFLERKHKGRLAPQNIVFLVNYLNIIKVWVCIRKKLPAVIISSQSISELKKEQERNSRLLIPIPHELFVLIGSLRYILAKWFYSHSLV